MSFFTLKLIAIITMTIDHIGYFNDIPLFRVIGRVSFPIFAFLIANGIRYSSNIKKYLATLLGFALLMSISINSFYYFMSALKMPDINIIFYTLFLGGLASYLHKQFFFTNKLILIPISLLLLLALYLKVDYGFLGVLLIYLFYLSTDKISTFLITLLFSLLTYTNSVYIVFSLISFLPIYFYNGSKGFNLNKYFFYIYYPLHFLVIYLLSSNL